MTLLATVTNGNNEEEHHLVVFCFLLEFVYIWILYTSVNVMFPKKIYPLFSCFWIQTFCHFCFGNVYIDENMIVNWLFFHKFRLFCLVIMIITKCNFSRDICFLYSTKQLHFERPFIWCVKRQRVPFKTFRVEGVEVAMIVTSSFHEESGKVV